MTHIPAHLADDILNGWIDGIATPDEQSIVDQHLASCETCQLRMGELQAVKAILGDMEEIAPPRSFTLTPDQAKQPTPIGERVRPSNIIRLLPIVRTLSVAAMLAVLILGGSLVLGQDDSTSVIDQDQYTEIESGETSDMPASLGAMNPAPAPQSRGEVVEQGESASAHDSTSTSLAREAQPAPVVDTTEAGLTGLEITTIVLGVASILLGITWMWMSMAIRSGRSR